MTGQIFLHFDPPADAAIPPSGFRGPPNSEISRRGEILKLIPRGSIGAELGVFCGNFSLALVALTQPARLHLVDPWWKANGDFYADWGTYTDFGKLGTKHAYALTIDNLMRIKREGDVHIHNEFSAEWLATIPEAYLDWAYIDSSHAYEQTLEELHLLERKVKKSGLIFGDDFYPDETHVHHGVYRAVQKFTRDSPYDLVYADANMQWAIKPSPNNAPYGRACLPGARLDHSAL
jgi:Methyltransferase domain